MATTNGTARDNTIALVGGGIGGLCLAIGLLNKKVPLHIYEAAPAFAEIGAGVSFGPNSTRAMEMISPAILQAFKNCVTHNAYPDHKDIYFSFRRGQDKSSKVGTPIYDFRSDIGATSVHRAKYLDELIRVIPDDVSSFGKRLDQVDDKGDHVILHFKDGTSARHAAVICCDGIKSRGREILLGDDHPAAHAKFSGKYAYRGLIPMDDAARLMGDELARNAQLFMGRGGHILTFPIEKGKTMNVVAFGTAAEWTDPAWVKPMDKADMRADFADWVGAAHEIIDLMQKPDVWALFEMPEAPTYTKGRMCLLGDAAHASTPHQGAGAGMAIEDALVMSELLAEVYKGGQEARQGESGIERAFAAYDKVRRPRSQRLVRSSKKTGLLYDFELEGVGDDTEKIKKALHAHFEWVWDEDLNAHVKEAIDEFKAGKLNGVAA